MSELEDQLRQQIRRMEIDLQLSENTVDLLKRELDLIQSRVELNERLISSIHDYLETARASR